MKKPKELPAQDVLQHIFAYEPATGVLTWKNPRANCLQPGMVAGRQALKGKRYIEVGLFRTRWQAHRLIWKMQYGYDPELIDHKDNNGFNNRIKNLREATHSQNMMNQRVWRTFKRTCVLKGVTLDKGRYVTRASGVYVGSFDTEEQAHKAYVAHVSTVFGEFANDGVRL